VTAQAGRTASLRAPVSATGGAYGGGSVAVYGRDRVEVLTTLDADGGGGDGDGGTITARGAAVWVDGATLRARGASGGGGGEVTIEACELDISRTAALDTLRAGGHNLLIVHGDATVAGTLDAGDHNELRYLAAPPTIDPGARLRPAPTLVADPGLATCPA
ncbi:MAG TPA: hypothetical protein PKA64_03145, partial [Myxococcota bacterium]|nr:hypothetical protein [Myxococcota bacterium]